MQAPPLDNAPKLKLAPLFPDLKKHPQAGLTEKSGISSVSQAHDRGCAIAHHTNYRSEISDSIDLLYDPHQAWHTRLKLVNEAESSIVFTSFYVEPDEKGLMFLDALIRAAERGVMVMVAIDGAIQNINSLWLGTQSQRKAIKTRIDRLVSLGGIIGWYGTFSQHLKLPAVGLHYKSLVVDGKCAIVGGRNIGGLYYGDPIWHDFEALLKGSVVSNLSHDALEAIEVSSLVTSQGNSDEMQRALFKRLRKNLEAQ
ncbi:MAG: hypothetical protein HQM16_15745 [Deltaproteobacteria bacterium]|nr:hypothetical protein [Deltaproteobacteria bacterium]